MEQIMIDSPFPGEQLFSLVVGEETLDYLASLCQQDWEANQDQGGKKVASMIGRHL